jgi:hypothetical protein
MTDEEKTNLINVKVAAGLTREQAADVVAAQERADASETAAEEQAEARATKRAAKKAAKAKDEPPTE